MNKLLTKIAGLSIGLAMAIGVGVVVGSKDAAKVEATDTNVSFTTGSNTVAIKVNWNSAGAPSSNNGVRMGTSSNAGSATFSIPSGTTKFGFYAVGWKGKSTTASVSASVGTITSSTASLTSNDAATGTISANATVAITETEANAKKEFTISGVTSASTITLTTSGSNKRLIAWDAYYVSASKTLSGIEVKTAPTKTTYYAGDYFDPTGLELTATYSDSSTETISYASHSSDFTFTPSTSTALTQSNTSVTIAYGGKSTTQAITVNPARTLSNISVSTAPTQTTYSEGQYFDPTGLVITRTFSDSSSDTYTYANHTSEFSFSPSTSTPLTTSDKSVTITYGGKTAAQAITVNEVTKYELVTEATGLVSGCNYLIGNASQTKFMSTTQNGNNRGVHTLSGTVTNNKVGFESGMEVVTLGGSSGAWTLYANNSETAGYLYLPSNNNYLRTRASEFSWGISFDDGTPLISATVTSERWIKYNGGNTIFSCYTSGQENISLWKEVSTAESVSISKDSVSGFKGDADTTISITAVNFDPTNIEVSYSTAGVATVTKGTISNRIIPLNVAFNSAGTTTATITVKGGKADYSVDLGISVEAKPSILRVVESRTANPLVDITSIEIENGDSTGHSFSKLNIYVEDTDGNAIEIGTISDYVTLSRISGDDCVTISGGKITGNAVGTAVIKFELKSLTSVYDTVTVNVSNDYKDTVNLITFNSSLTATQGDSVDASEVFATRVANTHFGSTETIADSEFLYSYSNNRSGAEAYNVFSYDFSHGTTVDSTHKSQTIYVFVTFDEEYSDSFTITVEQKDDPLTAIALTNVTDNELSVSRGGSFQLEWAYTPENPTDGKEVVFTISENDDDIDITVSSSGLISIGSSSNLGEAMVTIESAHDSSISDFVIVSATLESMTYVVSEEESWSVATSISAGDNIVISGSHSSTNYELTGVSSNIGQVASFGDNPAGTFMLTVGEGSEENSFTFSNGTAYLAYTNTSTSSNNYLYLLNNPSTTDQLSQVSWTVSISDGIATITNVYNTSRKIMLNYNQGSPRFCAYTSSASSTMHLPSIYVLSGGDTPYTVTETLFNGVHNNFGGEGATYEWDASCASFDSESWEDACDALKGITGYSTYKLNRAVGNIAGNEIEQFIAKYDIIIGKTSTDYDFLGRFSSGGINANTRIDVNPIQLSAKNTSAVIIIVVISSISIAAVGGYFLFRRRKEQ